MSGPGLAEQNSRETTKDSMMTWCDALIYSFCLFALALSSGCTSHYHVNYLCVRIAQW